MLKDKEKIALDDPKGSAAWSEIERFLTTKKEDLRKKKVMRSFLNSESEHTRMLALDAMMDMPHDKKMAKVFDNNTVYKLMNDPFPVVIQATTFALVKIIGKMDDENREFSTKLLVERAARSDIKLIRKVFWWFSLYSDSRGGFDPNNCPFPDEVIKNLSGADLYLAEQDGFLYRRAIGSFFAISEHGERFKDEYREANPPVIVADPDKLRLEKAINAIKENSKNLFSHLPQERADGFRNLKFFME